MNNFEQANTEKSPAVASVEKSKPWFKTFLERTTDQKLLRVYTLAFASLFGQHVHAEPIVDKTSPETLAQADQAAIERFGVSLSEACAKARCKIVIQQPSQNGKYIINIPQIHAYTLDGAIFVLNNADHLKNMEEVIDSQKAIYDFVAQLDNPVIVEEGIDGEEGMSAYSYFMAPAVTLSADFMTRAHERITNSINEGNEESYLFGDRELYNYRVSSNPNLKDLPRVDDLYDLSKANNAFKAKTQEYYKPIQFTIPYSDREKVLYIEGAISTLITDGKSLGLMPGDKATHGEDCDKMEKANNRYAVAEYHNGREEFAISQAIKSGDVMPIIVYGADHNFAPNVAKVDYEAGVIRIETSSTASSKSVIEEIEEADEGMKADIAAADKFYKDQK